MQCWNFSLEFSIIEQKTSDVQSYSPRSNFVNKMNLTSLLITNFLSVSNLTHFLDRLINDGNHKTVLLVYDEASVRDTNFLPELADLAFQKYSVVIVNRDQEESWMAMKPYNLQFGLLEVILMDYSESGRKGVEMVLDSSTYHNRHSMILLIPMQDDDRRTDIWKCFNASLTIIRYINMTVVFYQAEMSTTTTKTLEKSIKVFVLDYEPFRAVEIEVENQSSIQSNLNEKIFGSILNRPNLITRTTVSAYTTNQTVPSENSASVNWGNAELYLSNFISRNLRAKNVVIQQLLTTQIAKGRLRDFACNASNEKYYAELYNTPLGPLQYIRGFVFTDFVLRTGISILENDCILFHRIDSLRVLEIGTTSNELDFLYYPLYPHKFDDLVFIIYQRGNLKDQVPRSSTEPLTLWLIFTFITALMLLLLREIVERRNRRLNRRLNYAVTPDYLLGSFVELSR